MKPLYAVLVLALAVAAAGCGKAKSLSAPTVPFTGGSANLTRYVAMGTSISAGVQSGGLVVTHQQKAFPWLFSRQIGVAAFTIPSVSAYGLPPLLRIAGVTPLGGVIINNTGLTPGVPTNFGQATAYHDMGVPGAILPDAADSSLYYIPSRTSSFSLVVRHRGTILSEAASLGPTFVTFEFGSNEILGPAISGSGTAVVPTGTWVAVLNLTLNALQAVAPSAKLALFTVPDPTTIPHMTTFKPYTLNASGQLVALLGPSGALSPGDLIPLGASDSLAAGVGFPVGTVSYLSGAPGTGRPLPDRMVLSTTEIASLRTALAAYNAAVLNEATARNAALVDLHGLLQDLSLHGYRFQGQTLTTAFVSGGLFSLDGIHPTDIGHGILCNALIDAVNLHYGATIPHVDLNQVASPTSSQARPAGFEESAMPWLEGTHHVLGGYDPWR